MKVKYLYKSFKKAKILKISSEYLFYLQLKSIGLDSFNSGEVIKCINKHFNYSPASISSQLKKLVKCGFVSIYKHENSKRWKYVLSSYQKVWNILGFRIKENSDSYRYENINNHLSLKKDLKSKIFAIEIERNSRDQFFQANRKLNKKIDYIEKTLSKNKSIKVISRKSQELIKLKDIKQCSVKQPIGNIISCVKSSALMGYKTPSTAVNLGKNCESLSLLSIKRTRTLVDKKVSRIDFMYSERYVNCYWKFGNVYKNECNSYSFESKKEPSAPNINCLKHQ